MVKVREDATLKAIEYPEHARTLAELSSEGHMTPTGESCLQAGLAMAKILSELEVDQETIAAALVYPAVIYANLSLDDVEEQLGKNIAHLVLSVKRMHAIGDMQKLNNVHSARQQMDNLRKMLLAMVDDVRSVLIKLAEKLHQLRMASVLNSLLRQEIGQEVMDIYAPLANRLGVGTLKWEMEDLAFRYLQPDAYKAIATGLRARRVDRDNEVHHIVHTLEEALKKAHIHHYKVYGRAKHIHSIYRKMTQKSKSLSEIYDATAVRILVDSEQDCYAAFGLVHTLWTPIPSEFDDYIMQPKPNGYRSLHTAVITPEGRQFEVQIRTHEMHDLAELGVAAHWRYKEGGAPVKESHERKIQWLREVLSWHRELASAEGVSAEMQTEFLEDHVYVFTPMGQIIDLPQGSTSLDFAYHIHSDVGHRCRGAKINGAMVGLVTPLKMGDRVEILTAKQAHPSRDWLNPQLGYLKSARARAKVLHWFREQDEANNNTPKIDEPPKIEPRKSPPIISKPHVTSDISDTEDLTIEGVGNLLTHMAHCCKPAMHEPIVGYVTIGRGISIHRQDCPNIIHMDTQQENRLVKVQWGKKTDELYPVTLTIQAYDRPGLIRDITHVFMLEDANLIHFTTTVNKEEHIANIHLRAEVKQLEDISRLITQLKKMANVIEVIS